MNTRYEVTWMYFEYDWDSGISEQISESTQFKYYSDAVDCFYEKINDSSNEHVRIVEILHEYSR